MKKQVPAYTLIRSKRKTLSIQIKDGELIARAPMKLARADIDRFVASKSSWITDKLGASKQRIEQRDAYTLSYGDKILYRGAEYPIMARHGKHHGFDETGSDNKHFYVPPNLSSDEIKANCTQVYKLLAKNYIPKRTLEIAEIMGLAPASIKITNARTRWGSCNAKGDINYSWRLILASDELIDCNRQIPTDIAHIIEFC